MSNEFVRLFTDLTSNSLDPDAIPQFKEKHDEELHISCHVDKMSANTLILWLPNLNGHGLGEDLCQFYFCPEESQVIVRRSIVDRVGSLVG